MFLGNFRDLCSMLNKSTEILMRNGSQLDTVLEMLDLQQHSLGMLAVLCVKLSLPPPNTPAQQPSGPTAAPDYQEILFTQVQEFILGCNGEQVRFATETCEFVEYVSYGYFILTFHVFRGNNSNCLVI